MTASFTGAYPLRFAHCDPAGIAYYPRYFEIVDGAVEDWTASCLGVTRHALHLEHRLGLPTVDLHATFAAVSRLGDNLTVRIDVAEVGNSSILLLANVDCEGEQRFTVSLRQVLVRLDNMTATPWPPQWRSRLLDMNKQQEPE